MPSSPHAVLLRAEGLKWSWLQKQGAEVNPCNSALHPAVLAGLQPKGNERSVQEAYNPSSQCFGCGACVGHLTPCVPTAAAFVGRCTMGAFNWRNISAADGS